VFRWWSIFFGATIFLFANLSAIISSDRFITGSLTVVIEAMQMTMMN